MEYFIILIFIVLVFAWLCITVEFARGRCGNIIPENTVVYQENPQP